MTTLRYTLEMALDALEIAYGNDMSSRKNEYYSPAIDALHKALAESATTESQALRNIYEIWAGSEGIPVPETAVEAYLMRLIKKMRDEASKAIESEEKQEPVGLMIEDSFEIHKTVAYGGQVYQSRGAAGVVPMMFKQLEVGEKLYTAPPQKEWVGLTEGEIKDVFEANSLLVHDDLYAEIEAKLKEKNT